MSTPDSPSSTPETPEPGSRARSRSARRIAAPPPARDGTPLALAIVGVALGVLALAIAVGNVVGVFGGSSAGSSGSSCQRVAWAAVPRSIDLESGWAIQAPDFGPSSVTADLVGPAAADGSTSSVYVRITCYGGSDGTDALARLKAASIEGGADVTALTAGDEGYTYSDPASGAVAATFRRGNLVASVVLSVGDPATDLTPSVNAVDASMKRAQGSGGLAIPVPITPAPVAEGSPGASTGPGSSDNASPDASASPAAPELEALLPSKVAGVDLSKDSYTGADVFTGSDSAVTRALAAALNEAGKKPADFLIAEALDSSGTLALDTLMAFKVNGLAIAKFEPVILQTILSSNVTGVKTTDATIGGKAVQVIDYGDGGSKSYTYITGDVLILISTTDEKIATEILTGLK